MPTFPFKGDRVATAIVTVILAIFLFDVQGALIKHMGQRYPIEQIAFFRNMFGILPHLLVMLHASRWRPMQATWKIARWQLGFGRGVVLVTAQVAFYYSLMQMQLATATTLAFSGPLFVTLFSIPILGHKVGLWRTLAVLLGFCGVLLIVKPGTDAFQLAAFLPIIAAICYAFVSISSRLFDVQDATALINMYSTSGAIVVSLALAIITGNWTGMQTISDWLWFFAMGMAGGCAVFLLISAYRMAEPSSLSPFEYFGIPFSFMLGWVFFDETPFDSLFPGVFLIVAGGLLVILRERQLKQR